MATRINITTISIKGRGSKKPSNPRVRYNPSHTKRAIYHCRKTSTPSLLSQILIPPHFRRESSYNSRLRPPRTNKNK